MFDSLVYVSERQTICNYCKFAMLRRKKKNNDKIEKMWNLNQLLGKFNQVIEVSECVNIVSHQKTNYRTKFC